MGRGVSLQGPAIQIRELEVVADVRPGAEVPEGLSLVESGGLKSLVPIRRGSKARCDFLLTRRGESWCIL